MTSVRISARICVLSGVAFVAVLGCASEDGLSSSSPIEIEVNDPDEDTVRDVVVGAVFHYLDGRTYTVTEPVAEFSRVPCAEWEMDFAICADGVKTRTEWVTNSETFDCPFPPSSTSNAWSVSVPSISEIERDTSIGTGAISNPDTISMYKVVWGGNVWYAIYNDRNSGSFELNTPVVELGVSFASADLEILKHVDKAC